MKEEEEEGEKNESLCIQVNMLRCVTSMQYGRKNRFVGFLVVVSAMYDFLSLM